MPAMDQLGIGCSRSPSRPTTTAAIARLAASAEHRSPRARTITRVFEFDRVIEDGAITILQPDLSKCGGLTEALRIAALASAWKLPLRPARARSRNSRATIVCAFDNGAIVEAPGCRSRQFATAGPELGGNGSFHAEARRRCAAPR